MTNNVTTASSGLNRNAIGLWSLVFFVLATNGPLTGLVGVAPTAILLGNGIGLPSAYLVAGGVYLLFCVGFVAMSRYIRNTGAFYAYVANGLGRPAGTAAAFLAIVAYAGLQIACYGMIGFFLAHGLGLAGLSLPWWCCSLFVVLVVQLLSTRNVAVNGKALGLFMTLEVIVISLFDLGGVLHGGGPAGFTTESFTVGSFMSHGVGAVFVFVASSFMGIETTAIYSEEARNPERTVPNATYIAVILITALLVCSSWLLILSFGPSNILQQVTAHPGDVWFIAAERNVGSWLAVVMNVLLITSLFSIVLSLQNTLSRYLYALGREGVFLSHFARLHSRHKTPWLASLILSLVHFVLLLACGLHHINPMTGLLPIGSAPAALGILSVQVLTSCAVIGYFKGNRRHTNLWQRLVAPLLAIGAMGFGVILIVMNMDLLTGGVPVLDWLIPLGLVLIALYGALVAIWLRRYRPAEYANLGQSLNNEV